MKGVRLGDCWEALELPEASGLSLRRRTGMWSNENVTEKVLVYLRIGMWSYEKVLAYFGELQAKRAIACAMVSHARLGQASRWSGLDPNLIWMIWSLLRKAELVEYAFEEEE